jgi:CRISPR/Cas system-associated protein Cas5 (RAMP superfamily)
MNRICFFLIFLFWLLSCSENKNQEKELKANDIQVGTSENLPVITFENVEYDFGKITQGEVVSVDFHFRNTGKTNLIISGASGSCGCTVPKWPKEPIAPNKTGVIQVVFDSEGKRGYQEKTITVATNCEPATILLKIKGEIIVPETIK